MRDKNYKQRLDVCKLSRTKTEKTVLQLVTTVNNAATKTVTEMNILFLTFLSMIAEATSLGKNDTKCVRMTAAKALVISTRNPQANAVVERVH